jgi:hypothetical protein
MYETPRLIVNKSTDYIGIITIINAYKLAYFGKTVQSSSFWFLSKNAVFTFSIKEDFL